MRAELFREGGKDNIQIVKAPKSDIGKSLIYNDDDEINYHGKLYDIAHKEVKGDTVYFYCINDREEENLYAGLNVHTLQNTGFQSEKQGNHSAQLIKLIVKDYCQSSFRETQNSGYFSKTSFPENIRPSSGQYSSIFIPPPNQSVS